MSIRVVPSQTAFPSISKHAILSPPLDHHVQTPESDISRSCLEPSTAPAAVYHYISRSTLFLDLVTRHDSLHSFTAG